DRTEADVVGALGRADLRVRRRAAAVQGLRPEDGARRLHGQFVLSERYAVPLCEAATSGRSLTRRSVPPEHSLRASRATLRSSPAPACLRRSWTTAAPPRTKAPTRSSGERAAELSTIAYTPAGKGPGTGAKKPRGVLDAAPPAR